MSHIEKNQENIPNNIQAEISFLHDMEAPIMNLPRY